MRLLVSKYRRLIPEPAHGYRLLEPLVGSDKNEDLLETLLHILSFSLLKPIHSHDFFLNVAQVFPIDGTGRSSTNMSFCLGSYAAQLATDRKAPFYNKKIPVLARKMLPEGKNSSRKGNRQLLTRSRSPRTQSSSLGSISKYSCLPHEIWVMIAKYVLTDDSKQVISITRKQNFDLTFSDVFEIGLPDAIIPFLASKALLQAALFYFLPHARMQLTECSIDQIMDIVPKQPNSYQFLLASCLRGIEVLSIRMWHDHPIADDLELVELKLPKLRKVSISLYSGKLEMDPNARACKCNGTCKPYGIVRVRSGWQWPGTWTRLQQPQEDCVELSAHFERRRLSPLALAALRDWMKQEAQIVNATRFARFCSMRGISCEVEGNIDVEYPHPQANGSSGNWRPVEVISVMVPYTLRPNPT